MYDFLAVIGGFSLILCAVIVLLFPVLMAFLVSSAWLWLYALYLVGFALYVCLVVSAMGADDRATQDKGESGGPDQ